MSQSPTQKLSAVLLAAGESRRMGSINKLSLPIEGTPLLRRAAQTLLSSGLQEVVVVVGHEQEVSRDLLRDLPLRIVFNERFREGQMTSVHCGLGALGKPCAGVMICLSDQVLLNVDDIELISRGFEKCPTSILVPVYGGDRGNPIVLDYAHRETILTSRRNLGCRRLIANNPQLVTTLEMPNDHVLVDLDTPEAYSMVRSRLAGNGEKLKIMTETG